MRLTGKELYEQKKLTKKQTNAPKLKEFRLRPGIDIHDLNIKINRIEEFLKQKHNVRLRLTFKGRQVTHADLGWNVINTITTRLETVGKITTSKFEGKQIVVMISPK